MTPRARLMGRVEYDPNGGCWLWSGALVAGGYGTIADGGRQMSTHRLSYKVHRGEIPDGLFVLHRCDVRACINPDHLFLGTENIDDARRKGRRAQKLTWAQVREIRASTEKQYACAARYGVNQSVISDIRRGVCWIEDAPPEGSRP